MREKKGKKGKKRKKRQRKKSARNRREVTKSPIAIITTKYEICTRTPELISPNQKARTSSIPCHRGKAIMIFSSQSG